MKERTLMTEMTWPMYSSVMSCALHLANKSHQLDAPKSHQNNLPSSPNTQCNSRVWIVVFQERANAIYELFPTLACWLEHFALEMMSV